MYSKDSLPKNADNHRSGFHLHAEQYSRPPSKFQAYLATHKPIYAIFKGEIKKIVEEYGLGIVAHPSNIEEIAAGLEAFLNLSDIQMKSISENSLRLLNSVFNREKIIEQINSIYWRS